MYTMVLHWRRSRVGGGFGRYIVRVDVSSSSWSDFQRLPSVRRQSTRMTCRGSCFGSRQFHRERNLRMKGMASGSQKSVRRGRQLVLLLAVLSCGCEIRRTPAPVVAPAKVGCVSNAECKSGRVCQEGKCVTPSAITPEIQARIDEGDVALDVLRAIVKSKECPPLPGLTFALDELEKDVGYRAKLHKHLLEGDPSYKEAELAYGEWLLLVDRHGQVCEGGAKRETLVRLATDGDARVREDLVERALKASDCGTLSSINLVALWPFESRFVGELANREFAKAEVTQRLWLDTLASFRKQCSKDVSRPEEIVLEATSAKLSEIVGLQDERLIELRGRVMSAMERWDLTAVRSSLSSVARREKALDEKNEEAFDTRKRAILDDYERVRSEVKAAEKERKREAKKTGEKVPDTAPMEPAAAARMLFRL